MIERHDGRTAGRTDEKTFFSEAEDKYKIRSELFWSDLNICLIDIAIFPAATGSKVTFYLDHNAE